MIVEKIINSDKRGIDSRNDCFTTQSGLIELKNLGLDISLRSSKLKFHFIQDWKQSKKYTNKELPIMNTINKLDCTPYSWEFRRQYDDIKFGSNEHVSRNVLEGQLLKQNDGDSYVYSEKIDEYNHIKYLEVIRPRLSFSETQNISPIKVRLTPQNMLKRKEWIAFGVSSFFDESMKNYLLYETTREFNSKMEHWPLYAWRMNKDLQIIENYALPAGPWVKPQGLFKQLSCFSCGCSCYSSFKLYGGGGKTFAAVSAPIDDEASSGIFQLINTNKGSSWDNLYAGKLSSKIIVSPNGCKIVFSDKEDRLKYLNICNPQKKHSKTHAT